MVDLEPELDLRARGCRLDTQPDGGEERIRLGMQELDRLAGAGGTLDVDRRRPAEGDVEAVVARQRRLDDLLLNLAVERDGQLAAHVVLPDVDQRVLLGELRERDAKPPAVVGSPRRDDGLQRRRRELVVRPPPLLAADAVADLDAAEAPELGDLSGRHRRPLHGRPVVENADRSHLRLVATAELQPIADVDRAGEHADIRDALAGGTALDLEDGAGDGAVRVAGGRGQQVDEARRQQVHAGAGDRRPEEHRVHDRAPRLRRERLAQARRGHARLVVDIGGQERLVVLYEHLYSHQFQTLTSSRALAIDGHHRDRGRRQSLRDVAQHPFAVGACTIDLVHEDQRRDAKPLQRAHQGAGLRLHALDGRDDQHRAVEHVQHPLHLGDEVRMARRVDQVDGDVVHRERDDGRLDRDAALLLER